jgi:hypothetical protein
MQAGGVLGHLPRCAFSVSDTLLRSDGVCTGEFLHGCANNYGAETRLEEDTLEIWADKEWMVAKTSEIILRYKVNSGRFTKDNLQIMWREGGKRIYWTMADVDKATLVESLLPSTVHARKSCRRLSKSPQVSSCQHLACFQQCCCKHCSRKPSFRKAA